MFLPGCGNQVYIWFSVYISLQVCFCERKEDTIEDYSNFSTTNSTPAPQNQIVYSSYQQQSNLSSSNNSPATEPSILPVETPVIPQNEIRYSKYQQQGNLSSTGNVSVTEPSLSPVGSVESSTSTPQQNKLGYSKYHQQEDVSLNGNSSVSELSLDQMGPKESTTTPQNQIGHSSNEQQGNFNSGIIFPEKTGNQIQNIQYQQQAKIPTQQISTGMNFEIKPQNQIQNPQHQQQATNPPKQELPIPQYTTVTPPENQYANNQNQTKPSSTNKFLNLKAIQNSNYRQNTNSSLNRYLPVIYNNIIENISHPFPRYQADWKSLDRRPSPGWYDEAKVGVIIHWGVYSVPSFGVSSLDIGYGEWFLEEWKGRRNPDFQKFVDQHYPGFEYKDFANQWKAEFFDASQWADIIESSGAKYVVLTTKHHDGFTLWSSNQSKFWNSVDVGPHREIVDEFMRAFRKKKGIHTGLYFSLNEWFHPLFLFDKRNRFKTRRFVEEIVFPQMYDYVTRFQPSYIWSDGDWDADADYWKSKEFLSWLYNDSPVRDSVLVNDRWGHGTGCRHGDVKTCGADRFNPGTLQPFKWENAMTIDKYSWGFRRNAPLEDYYTTAELTNILAKTISCGGNLLMNIGPAADGTIPPIYQLRLKEMGIWLKSNGEAIYGSTPWRVQKATADGRIWYTSNANSVYAIVSDWKPKIKRILLRHPLPTGATEVSLLGYKEPLPWRPWSVKGGIVIDISKVDFSLLEHQWAYTYKMTYVE